MPRSSKVPAPSVSEKNTKSEILKAYHSLIDQITTSEPETDVKEEEQRVLEVASHQTVEKVLQDLSQLRLSANQTINTLTEQLTGEAEQLSNLQKAIGIAKKELEETQKIKMTAGTLYRMIELHKQEEEKFIQEIATRKAAWAQEQQSYEEQRKRERTREEEEYAYQKRLKMKRDSDAWEEEQRKREREKREEAQFQEEKTIELNELRKRVTVFPIELEKAIKESVSRAIAEEKKEAQMQKNFMRQETETKERIAGLKISSLENTARSQVAEIADLKRQLEQATRQVKDIAVAVIEGPHKDNSDIQQKNSP